jgi:ABC-type transport system involved in multi-copper enzyme maturation permease subunit
VLGFFPRWLEALTSSSRVQQVTVISALIVAVFLIAGYALRLETIWPYGLVSLVLGLCFVLAYSRNETEISWRHAAVNVVGVIGAVTALVGLSSVATDLVGLEEILLPHGLSFGVVGLILLWAFISLRGGDTDVGHRMAQALMTAGGVVILVALARSIFQTYMVPSGVLLLTLGFAYLAVGAGYASDIRLIVLTRRELTALFYSPIAYVVIASIALVAWGSFWWFLTETGLLPPTETARVQPVAEPILRYYFARIFPIICLIFTVPALTMRLLSEEKQSGTIEVLLTAPVGETAVVLSKFFGVLIFFMLTWSTWAFYPIALRIIGQESFDYRPLLSFYLGLTFMGAGFLSMGLFFSSLTRDQIIAQLLTFAGMILLTLNYLFVAMGEMEGAVPAPVVAVLRYISYVHHLEEFVQGKVHLKYLLSHLSITVFWLFLTVKVLEARKWR